MKVRLNLEIEVDADRWASTFGIATGYERTVGGRIETYNDVQQYVLNAVRHVGVFGNGEVPAKVTVR